MTEINDKDMCTLMMWQSIEDITSDDLHRHWLRYVHAHNIIYIADIQCLYVMCHQVWTVNTVNVQK